MSYVRTAATPVLTFIVGFFGVQLLLLTTLTEPEMFNKNHVNKLEELEHHISELVNATQGLTRVVEQEIALRKRLQAQVDELRSAELTSSTEIKCHNKPKSTH
jgi:hypothetical protein